MCFLASRSALFSSHVCTCRAAHLNFQLLEARDWQCLFVSLLPALVSTLPAQNRSPVNVSWTRFNTNLIVATLLCQSLSSMYSALNKLLPTQCDQCRVQRTINISTEEAYDYIHSILATTSYCWFILSFFSHMNCCQVQLLPILQLRNCLLNLKAVT